MVWLPPLGIVAMAGTVHWAPSKLNQQTVTIPLIPWTVSATMLTTQEVAVYQEHTARLDHLPLCNVTEEATVSNMAWILQKDFVQRDSTALEGILSLTHQLRCALRVITVG